MERIECVLHRAPRKFHIPYIYSDGSNSPAVCISQGPDLHLGRQPSTAPGNGTDGNGWWLVTFSRLQIYICMQYIWSVRVTVSVHIWSLPTNFLVFGSFDFEYAAYTFSYITHHHASRCICICIYVYIYTHIYIHISIYIYFKIGVRADMMLTCLRQARESSILHGVIGLLHKPWLVPATVHEVIGHAVLVPCSFHLHTYMGLSLKQSL